MKNPTRILKRVTLAGGVILTAMLSAPAILFAARSTSAAPDRIPVQYRAIQPGQSVLLFPQIAQDEAPEDEDAIPGDQVDKYIAVYGAMQKDHSLSVDQATAKQGITVAQFRNLEDKIERNPVIHQRVLDALKTKTAGDKSAASMKSGSGKSKTPSDSD